MSSLCDAPKAMCLRDLEPGAIMMSQMTTITMMMITCLVGGQQSTSQKDKLEARKGEPSARQAVLT